VSAIGGELRGQQDGRRSSANQQSFDYTVNKAAAPVKKAAPPAKKPAPPAKKPAPKPAKSAAKVSK
jgi:hypothetical protein